METYIGVVTHYYNHLGVAVLSLTGELKLNAIVHILGSTTDFVQEVHSLEIYHEKVTSAQPGDAIALKTIDVVRAGDKLYLAPDATPTEPRDILYQRTDAWER